MKKYCYPVILYSDAEKKNYTVLFPDLDVVGSGETPEEAYLSAESYLEAYLEFASKMQTKIANPSTFEETMMLNPKKSVMLADAVVDSSFQLTDSENQYKNFISQFLTTAED